MRRNCILAAGSAAILFAAPAIAGLPAVADRVPTDALVTVTIENLGAFHENLTGFLDRTGIPVDDEPLEIMEFLLDADGLDTNGSFAFVLMPDQGDVEALVIAPVNNYNAFVRGFGGEPGEVSEFEVEGNSVFARDLGDGFAVLGPRGGVVREFDGAAGRIDDHHAAMGATGKKLADRADLVVVANVPALAPQLKQGLEQQMQQVAGMAQMMGGAQAEQMEGQMAIMKVVADSFFRDAETAMLGFDLDESGITLDLASQFKEGSEIAGFFSGSGNTGKLMTRLPKMDYLFAGAFDTSPNGVSTIARNLVGMMEEHNLSQPGFDIEQWLTAGDGFASIMVKTPGLLAGGLFSNTATYIRSDDGASVANMFKKTYADLDGSSQQGITYKTSFDSGGVEIGGSSVDAWSMGFEVDPNNPNAFQMQQGMMMILGPELKMSGYGAALENGYVQTMSQNDELMSKVIESANVGAGLGTADGIRAMSRRLPRERTGEVYVGIDTLLGYGMQVMQMMGGPAQIDVPENLNPIAIGMTTDEGGFRAITLIPSDVIDTIAGLAQAMGGGGGQAPAEDRSRF
ncbi:MAG: hypothetical protein AAF138_11275 [Planctomycetota bacterium]